MLSGTSSLGQGLPPALLCNAAATRSCPLPDKHGIDYRQAGQAAVATAPASATGSMEHCYYGCLVTSGVGQ